MPAVMALLLVWLVWSSGRGVLLSCHSFGASGSGRGSLPMMVLSSGGGGSAPLALA